MKVSFTFALAICHAKAFAPHSIKNQIGSSSSPATRNGGFLSMTAISDAQALLAKARALRQQAEADEHKLHSNFIEKKKCKNMEVDAVIQKLFPLNEQHNDSDTAISALAKRVEEHKLSTSMLVKVVERLHEREIAAKGLEHVEPSLHHEQVQFVRVAAPEEEELKRVQGLIQMLIDAATVIDKEYLKNEQRHHNVDASHWSRGSLGKVLEEKAHFLGREHEAEFKNRLEEYYEAARKKGKGYSSTEM